MPDLNSYSFSHIYEDLGIDTKKLFCAMLSVEWSPASLEAINWLIQPDDLYYSQNYPWIQGLVAADSPHFTLLFGLLKGIKPEHVREVLKEWQPTPLAIEEISYFESPTNEDYYVLIAKPEKNCNLKEAHKRLSLLPHINTFLEYKPHLTIAYIKKDKNLLESILMKSALANLSIKPAEIIYDNNSGDPAVIKKFS